MIRTVRYWDPDSHTIHLGLLQDGQVYSITRRVPAFTDPIPVWYTLRSLGLSIEDGFARLVEGASPAASFDDLAGKSLLLPPVDAREVWAAGVTYERSRQARNAETKLQDSVYDRVYDAPRPEIFFKATRDRVIAPGLPLGLRSDSSWMVPEPELSLVLTAGGDIVGWTLGDDLSSRDIEGENPLYLPQAKVFSRSCSFGPVLLWNTGKEIPAEWTLSLTIRRGEGVAFQGSVSLTQLRRPFAELIAYLRRDNPVPDGTVLMTGTGIVPPDEFTLQPGDVVDIELPEIGVLRNPIAAPIEG
ncbi:fumarylacetoacetate hydrolase family protein [Alicyclobacillus sp.]|uniref:fumarylacetoacetate hydrolase family protein n=1 Tax=Alicyclobacillus sp. TaxID=61169 RepID=UPI0025C23BAB|nr:fumarylacetoacetate hydrolase family protein [Alicyclobacillus sp.]MCL6517349.1 fumarylacetoacetate hydrolase family protein [Alicyclobacillus sp.]